MKKNRTKDCIILNEAERLNLATLTKLLKQDRHADLKKAILHGQLTVGALVKYSFHDEAVAELCQASDLNAHFQTYWAQCATDHEKSPYQPVSNISPFDLIRGQWLYWEYNRYKDEDSKSALLFLEHSAKLKCYSALSELCTLQLSEISDESEYQDIVNQAVCAAENYGTAGYLLLAVICNELGVKLHLTELFAVAYRAIDRAEKLYPASAHCVNIAYDGKSIDTLYPQLSSWFKAKQFFFNAIQEAGMDANQIISRKSLTLNDV